MEASACRAPWPLHHITPPLLLRLQQTLIGLSAHSCADTYGDAEKQLQVRQALPKDATEAEDQQECQGRGQSLSLGRGVLLRRGAQGEGDRRGGCQVGVTIWCVIGGNACKASKLMLQCCTFITHGRSFSLSYTSMDSQNIYDQ